MAHWTFITNHGAVLAVVAERGEITGREIASALGISERSVRRIITDLAREGYLQRRRVGRANSYMVNHHLPLRRAELHRIAVRDLLDLLLSQRPSGGG